MNIPLLKKIANLGKLGYEPDTEVTVVKVTTNAPDKDISHQRPRYVLVDDDGVSYIDCRIMHEIEQDLAALISTLGIKPDGRPLHELVPDAAKRLGDLEEFYAENQPTEEPKAEVKPSEEEDDNARYGLSEDT